MTAIGDEAEEDYVTSFRAMEDERDEQIDRLMRDLKGVTHVMAVAGPLLDNVVDAEDNEARGAEDEEEKREEEVRMPQQTGTTSTALPRHRRRENEVVDLINGLFESFTTAVYAKLEKMEETMKRVEKKVDKVGGKVARMEGEVGTMEEEVGGELKAVEVQTGLKRESRKSKFVKSPYMVVTQVKKKKMKKQMEEQPEMEEVEEVGGGSGAVIMEEGELGGEGSGDVKLEEGGGSGEGKLDSNVDLYRPIEERKKLFYAYYNGSGIDGHIKCKTGDYPREWFQKLLTMGTWLEDSVSYFHLIFLIFACVFHTYLVVFI